MNRKMPIKLNFRQLFPTEQACIEYLFPIRRKHGFYCPKCRKRRNPKLQPDNRLRCSQCFYRTTLIAHTRLHGTHLPMLTWFEMFWKITYQPQLIYNAKDVQREYQIGSYKNARAALRRFRTILKVAVFERLSNRITLSCAPIRGVQLLDIADPRGNPCVLLAIAYYPPREGSNLIMQGIRVKYCQKPALPLHKFILSTQELKLGDRIVNILDPNPDLKEAYIRIFRSDHSMLIQNINKWIADTHMKISVENMQEYLDEFMFRRTAWHCDTRKRYRLFKKLLLTAVEPQKAKGSSRILGDDKNALLMKGGSENECKS